MIARLSGILTLRSPERLVIDVNGVGYLVHSPLSTFYELPAQGQSVTLNIYTHVSDQAMKLFGFLSDEEQTLFENLISVNKVGPKLALAILSGMDPEKLIGAIQANDVALLSRIPGVGKKTAERLALEMRDKLPKMDIVANAEASVSHESEALRDALSALTNLGYRKADAEIALKRLSEQGDKDLETLIKESLNLLS
ncbi:MAG: Holliday junction branch migration protein RuvA [Candidatus Nitrohelix vancouverensis]|uniref:Holliday junction branch migration complex subunit RuvA n=1 Tax=Candidatus Nitrohelix vancouverensis TaxID=2705534 RepID=A0A7T0C4L3_9BACT|nr:MAG: Holliday junction branch migration protein RuvA [Candidatus Nitrohelix vancouverensis]